MVKCGDKINIFTQHLLLAATRLCLYACPQVKLPTLPRPWVVSWLVWTRRSWLNTTPLQMRQGDPARISICFRGLFGLMPLSVLSSTDNRVCFPLQHFVTISLKAPPCQLLTKSQQLVAAGWRFNDRSFQEHTRESDITHPATDDPSQYQSLLANSVIFLNLLLLKEIPPAEKKRVTCKAWPHCGLILLKRTTKAWTPSWSWQPLLCLEKSW